MAASKSALTRTYPFASIVHVVHMRVVSYDEELELAHDRDRYRGGGNRILDRKVIDRPTSWSRF